MEEKEEDDSSIGYGNPACISDSVKCLSGEETREKSLSSSSSSLCDSCAIRCENTAHVRDASAFFDLCLLLCGYLNGVASKRYRKVWQKIGRFNFDIHRKKLKLPCVRMTCTYFYHREKCAQKHNLKHKFEKNSNILHIIPNFNSPKELNVSKHDRYLTALSFPLWISFFTFKRHRPMLSPERDERS